MNESKNADTEMPETVFLPDIQDKDLTISHRPDPYAADERMYGYVEADEYRVTYHYYLRDDPEHEGDCLHERIAYHHNDQVVLRFTTIHRLDNGGINGRSIEDWAEDVVRADPVHTIKSAKLAAEEFPFRGQYERRTQKA